MIAEKQMEALMSTAVFIVVVLVVAVVVAAGAFAVVSARKRAGLRQRFGPEYDRVVEREGDRRSGERRLADAAHTSDALDVRDLTDDERAAFVERWHAVQAEFVDQPAAAAGHADDLIAEVARTRGYPDIEDDQERADLLAADHPQVMAPYREAGELRAANAAGGDTEALREAVVRYRALFDELVGGGSAKPVVEAR
jgi:hypothetical protein